MNGEGQRPPAANETAQASASDAPEPGNARYPQGGGGNGGNNGQQHGQPQQQPQQEGQGAGGRRRFRRNRRGGRGGGGKGGGPRQKQAPAPPHAPGRTL